MLPFLDISFMISFDRFWEIWDWIRFFVVVKLTLYSFLEERETTFLPTWIFFFFFFFFGGGGYRSSTKTKMKEKKNEALTIEDKSLNGNNGSRVSILNCPWQFHVRRTKTCHLLSSVDTTEVMPQCHKNHHTDLRKFRKMSSFPQFLIDRPRLSGHQLSGYLYYPAAIL